MEKKEDLRIRKTHKALINAFNAVRQGGNEKGYLLQAFFK